MDLLLQIDDILICLIHVRIGTELTWSQLLLLLASEVHHRSGVVSIATAKGTSTCEVTAFFEVSAAYREIVQI